MSILWTHASPIYFTAKQDIRYVMHNLAVSLKNRHYKCDNVILQRSHWLLIIELQSDFLVLFIHHLLYLLKSQRSIAILEADATNFGATTSICLIVVYFISHLAHIKFSFVNELIECSSIKLELTKTFKYLLKVFLRFNDTLIFLI